MKIKQLTTSLFWRTFGQRSLLGLCLILTVLTSVSAGFVVPAQADAVAQRVASSARYGIAAGGELAYQSPEKLATYMKNVRDLGVGRVRFDIDWDVVQYYGPKSYDWSPFDHVVDAANNEGLEITAVFTHTPKWARAADCAEVSSRCRPVNAAAYAAFVGEAVKRYAPKGIHNWEIWNEPNLSALWFPKVQPVVYTDYLKRAAVEVRKYDPQSLILLGGLTHTETNPEKGNSAPPDFLKIVYEHGGGDSFDAVAVHPYTYPFLPTYDNVVMGFDDMRAVRDVMVANGQPEKKVWITELGAPTGGPLRIATDGNTRTEIGADHVTEALQKRIFEESAHFVQHNTWIDTFFWYSYQDKSNNHESTENFFGILRADGSRKPVYDALRHAVVNSR